MNYELVALVVTGISMIMSMSYWGGRLSNKLDAVVSIVKAQEGKIETLQEKVSRHEAWIQDLRKTN